MGLEIERKFLVCDLSFVDMAESAMKMEQGYLSSDPDRTVRVRISGEKAFLTVKSRNIGAVRHEWEYEIPVDDAEAMLGLPGTCRISKTRYKVPFEGRIWEVDVFKGRHSGLILAEVELPSADTAVELPLFVADEVTGDERYYNSTLAACK